MLRNHIVCVTRCRIMRGMWRNCDLHTHTLTDGAPQERVDPQAFVEMLINAGIDVVAVTDHDSFEGVEAIATAAAETSLTVISGVEVSTDRGYILVLAPGPGGMTATKDFCARLGVSPGKQVAFAQLIDVATRHQRPGGIPFDECIVIVGAHVEQAGALLGKQALSKAAQLEGASQLHALEVADEGRLKEWRAGGVKQSKRSFTLIRGSDWHGRGERPDRATWIYLPEVDSRSFRHAFATPEASVVFGDAPPPTPESAITSIAIEGGFHDGLVLALTERTNAIIGAPSVGKSLVVDAIRHAFDSRCEIPEIQKLSEARMDKRFPKGSTVRVAGCHRGQPFELVRTRGAGSRPHPPFQPIIFSQNELSRRAMEERPSMLLLDMHCPQADAHKKTLRRLNDDLRAVVEALVLSADETKELALTVRNPIDGVDAVRRGIGTLAGTEDVARRDNDLARIHAWRTSLAANARSWLVTLKAPEGPVLPAAPRLETPKLKRETLLPQEHVKYARVTFEADVVAAGSKFEAAIAAALTEGESEIEKERRKTLDALAKGGFDGGKKVTSELGSLRTRLVALENDELQLVEKERLIDEGIARTREIVQTIEATRLQLRADRKAACASITSSMRSFFARVIPDAETDRLDRTLDAAKTGTRMWAKTLPLVRDSLDRERLVAIRCAQGTPEMMTTDAKVEEQDAITREALDRGRLNDLCTIAGLWPGDGFDISAKGDIPVPFDELTEGLRALAIKEISFASSAVPVVSDQPEDSVPPQAVFDKLVPTLREQRASRQFILVSHDANIVVAGDVERIIVMGAAGCTTGSLFDASIREAALELLEGGEHAFQQRSLRYGRAVRG